MVTFMDSTHIMHSIQADEMLHLSDGLEALQHGVGLSFDEWFLVGFTLRNVRLSGVSDFPAITC